MKKIDYWDLADSERLYYTSVNEAVEEILRNLQEEEKEIPSILTLTGFVKMKPDVKSEAICVLDNFNLWIGLLVITMMLLQNLQAE